MIGSTKWVTLIYIYLKREIIHHLIKEFESPVIDWYTRITKETFCCFRNNSNCLHDQKPHSSFEMLFHHPVTMYFPVVRRTHQCFLLDILMQLCWGAWVFSLIAFFDCRHPMYCHTCLRLFGATANTWRHRQIDKLSPTFFTSTITLSNILRNVMCKSVLRILIN